MDEARALYEQSIALDPNIFQTVFGWAQDGGDRPQLRPRRRAARRGREARAGQPGVRLTRAVLYGREQDYDKAVALLDAIERERGGGLGPVEWSEKGRLLDKMGRHDEAFAAFAEAKRRATRADRPRLLAEEAAALVRTAGRLLHRGATRDPAAGERSRGRRPADLHRRLSPLRHHDGRADALRASDDRGRRRTADHQRAHPAHPAHARQPARLSRRRWPISGWATSSRGSTTCATIICSAPASSGAIAEGGGMVHRQDAAQRDASRADRR